MKNSYIVGSLLAFAVLFAGVYCVTFTTLTQTIPLGLLLICVVLVAISSLRRSAVKTDKLSYFVCLTTIYFYLRAEFSPVASFAMEDLFLIFGMSSCYFITKLVRRKDVVERCVLITMTILIIVNLLMFVPAINELRDELLNFAKGEENTGLFNHRNFYSQFMALGCCVLLSYALFSKYPAWIRIIFVLLGISSGIAVFYSMSRGSTLALIVALLVIISLYYFLVIRIYSVKIRVIFILSVLITMVTTISGLIGVVKDREEGGDIALRDVRLVYFSMTIDQIPESPIIGSGSRSVEFLANQNWSHKLPQEYDFKFTHNEFLQVIADYGIIGFVLMVGLLVSTVAKSGSNILKSKTRSVYLEVSAIGSVTFISISSYFSFPLHSFVLVLYIGLIVGMLPSLPSDRQDTKLSKKIPNRLGVCAIIVFVISSVVFISPKLSKELRSGLIFHSNGITVDDANWEIEEKTKNQWYFSLVDVCKISPNNKRLKRLGALYLDKRIEAKTKDQKMIFLKKAKESFQRAKDFDPYDPTTRLNLALCFELEHKYEEASAEYIAMDKYVSRRELFFKYFLRALKLNKAIAEKNVRINNVPRAIDAYELCVGYAERRMDTSFWFYEDFITNYHRLLYDYMTLLITHKEFSRLETIIKLNSEFGHMLLTNNRGRNHIVKHARSTIALAKLYWAAKKDPRTVLGIVQKVKEDYLKVKMSADDKLLKEVSKNLAEIDRIEKYLKEKLRDN